MALTDGLMMDALVVTSGNVHIIGWYVPEVNASCLTNWQILASMVRCLLDVWYVLWYLPQHAMEKSGGLCQEKKTPRSMKSWKH